MTAGIVAALPGEARALARLRARGTAQLADGTRLALSGLGHERAAATAKKLVDDGVDCLISWGSAAALLPVLAPGDLLLPETIVTGDGQRLNCDAVLIEAFGARFDAGVRIRYGALAEASSVLANVAAKQVLHERTQAIAADMESAAIARVAEGLGRVKERHGADALGFISSSRCTGEENYLMQKLSRAAFGTNNCHQCAAT